LSRKNSINVERCARPISNEAASLERFILLGQNDPVKDRGRLRDMTALDKKTAAAAVKGIQTKFDDVGFAVTEHSTGGQKFITFSKMDEGAVLIGEFVGIKQDGKYGPEANVIDKDGVTNTFVLTAGLSDFKDPARISPGMMVKIVHNGLKMGKSGKEYRSFTVMTKKA